MNQKEPKKVIKRMSRNTNRVIISKTVKIFDDQNKELAAQSELQGISKDMILREALDDKLNLPKKEDL